MALPLTLHLVSSNPPALWLSAITGAATFILTLLTHHQLGVLRILPYSFHLTIDFSVAVAFFLAPVLFGFTEIDARYYWVNGAAVLFVVGFHKAKPATPDAG